MKEKGEDKALSMALSTIEQKFGRGSIMSLGEDGFIRDVEVIPSGALTLDIALGGGFPRGRVIEIFGPESSGKTTLSLQVIANAQKAGGTAVFIDAEHALDPSYAKKLGVVLNSLLISQPSCGEEALEIADTLVRSGAVDVVVVDSVAALVPRDELEGKMGDKHVGLQARLMSQALRKLTASISKTKTCAIFINQLREKIGITWGNPEVTTGGKALKFYSSVRIDIRRIAAIKKGDEVIGNRTLAKVVKNKIAPPFRKAEFDILYDRGISEDGAIIDLALKYKIIQQMGAWFSYNGAKLGQGKENVRNLLFQDKSLALELKNKILDRLKAAEQEKVAASADSKAEAKKTNKEE